MDSGLQVIKERSQDEPRDRITSKSRVSPFLASIIARWDNLYNCIILSGKGELISFFYRLVGQGTD
jgi:hypothetical protein